MFLRLRVDEAAYISSMGDFTTFHFLRRFRDIFKKSSMPILLSIREVSVKFFRRPRRKARAKMFPKLFGQHGFFSRNILNFRNLPTVFIKFDAFLLVTLWSSGTSICLNSRPRLQLTMPKSFGCRINFPAGKKEIF